MTPTEITKRRFPLAPFDCLTLDTPDEAAGAGWYKYASRTKPTFDTPGRVLALEYKGVFVMWSQEPLPAALVMAQKLYPTERSMARFILEVAAAEGHPETIELKGRPGVAVVMRVAVPKIVEPARRRADFMDDFGGPRLDRGVLRVTRYDEHGPVGHTDGRDMEELVKDAISDGYTEYAPGALDELAATWPVENPAIGERGMKPVNMGEGRGGGYYSYRGFTISKHRGTWTVRTPRMELVKSGISKLANAVHFVDRYASEWPNEDRKWQEENGYS